MTVQPGLLWILSRRRHAWICLGLGLIIVVFFFFLGKSIETAEFILSSLQSMNTLCF